MPTPHPHLPALLRVLAATRTLAAQTTFYAAGLGAVALLGGANLPPELQFFAGAVGAGAKAFRTTRSGSRWCRPSRRAMLPARCKTTPPRP